MWSYVAVAVGGALGSVARYWVGTELGARLGTAFPYGTFVVNVTGSFVIGLFLTLATERLALSPYYRLLIAVGFLGGYTTFSSFEYETLRLVETGAAARALVYVVLSAALGFAGCWAGALIARATITGVPAATGAAQSIGVPARPAASEANPPPGGRDVTPGARAPEPE